MQYDLSVKPEKNASLTMVHSLIMAENRNFAVALAFIFALKI